MSRFAFICIDSDEDLKEWQTKFEERIALLETKIGRMEREMSDTETKSSFLLHSVNESVREIGKLQAEADVILCYFYEKFYFICIAVGLVTFGIRM